MIHLVHHRVEYVFGGMHCAVVIFSGHGDTDIQNMETFARGLYFTLNAGKFVKNCKYHDYCRIQPDALDRITA